MVDGQKLFSQRQVPEVNSMIAAAAGQEFSIGGKGETRRMFLRRHSQGACELTCFDFPKADTAPFLSGNYVFAIGRKDRAHLVPAVGKSSHMSARLDLPEVDWAGG